MNRLNLPNRLYLKKLYFPMIIFAYTLISYYFWVFLFDLPIGRDEGQFLYIGKLVSEGSVLYEDILTPRSPLPLYFIAVFTSISGNNLYFIRLLVPLFNSLTAIIIYQIGKENWNSNVGKIASFLYVIGFSMPLFEEIFLTSEPFELFFGTFGIYYYLKNKKSRKDIHLIISGILIGLSILSKQYGLLFFSVIFLYEAMLLLAKRDAGRWLRFFKVNVVTLCGILIPITILLLLYAITGNLSALIDVYLHPWESLPGAGNIIRTPILSIPVFFRVVLGFSVVYALALFFFWKNLVELLRQKRNNSDNLLMVWAFVFSLLFLVAIVGPYVAHTLPPCVLMAAVVIDSRWNVSFASFKKLIIQPKSNIRFSALIAILVAISLSTNFWSIYSTDDRDRMKLSDQKEIAAYLVANTAEDERILAYDYAPEHYYLSGRDPPEVDFRIYNIGKGYLTDERVEELVESLQEYDVRYLIVYKNGIDSDMSLTPFSGIPRDEKYPSTAHFKEFLRNNYTLKEDGFQRYDIYYRESNSEWV